MDDEKLKEQSYHCVGSVIIPLNSYGPAIEKFTQELLEEVYREGLNGI